VNKNNNGSFDAATQGNVQQAPSETQASQTADGGGEVSGISADELKSQVFKAPQQEMKTVVRAVEGATATGSDAAALQKELQDGETNNVAEKFYKVVTGWLGQAKETFDLEWKNGSAFLNLGVNYTGGGSM